MEDKNKINNKPIFNSIIFFINSTKEFFISIKNVYQNAIYFKILTVIVLFIPILLKYLLNVIIFVLYLLFSILEFILNLLQKALKFIADLLDKKLKKNKKNNPSGFLNSSNTAPKEEKSIFKKIFKALNKTQNATKVIENFFNKAKNFMLKCNKKLNDFSQKIKNKKISQKLLQFEKASAEKELFSDFNSRKIGHKIKVIQKDKGKSKPIEKDSKYVSIKDPKLNKIAKKMQENFEKNEEKVLNKENNNFINNDRNKINKKPIKDIEQNKKINEEIKNINRENKEKDITKNETKKPLEIKKEEPKKENIIKNDNNIKNEIKKENKPEIKKEEIKKEIIQNNKDKNEQKHGKFVEPKVQKITSNILHSQNNKTTVINEIEKTKQQSLEEKMDNENNLWKSFGRKNLNRTNTINSIQK